MSDFSVYDVTAKLTLDADEYSKTLDETVKTLEKFGQTAERIFSEVGSAAV